MLGGTLITLLGAGLWGLNAVVSKYLMGRGIDTMWMVNFRMITSGLVLLIFALFRNPHGIFDIWKDRKSVIRLLVIALFAFGLCQPTYYISIDYSNAGIASAIQQTAPVFVLIYVIIKERRRPAGAELSALALVMAGSFLISTHGDAGALAIHPLALLSGLISALCCALYITLPSELIKRYGTFETVGWGLFLGGIFIAPFCKLWNFPSQWDVSLIAGMIFIILPGAAFAFALFLYGTSIVGPVRGGVYNLFEPVTALMASVLLLSQSFHPAEICGTAAILAGIAVLTVSRQEPANTEPAVEEQAEEEPAAEDPAAEEQADDASEPAKEEKSYKDIIVEKLSEEAVEHYGEGKQSSSGYQMQSFVGVTIYPTEEENVYGFEARYSYPGDGEYWKAVFTGTCKVEGDVCTAYDIEWGEAKPDKD